jgi:hypothetical protein
MTATWGASKSENEILLEQVRRQVRYEVEKEHRDEVRATGLKGFLARLGSLLGDADELEDSGLSTHAITALRLAYDIAYEEYRAREG